MKLELEEKDIVALLVLLGMISKAKGKRGRPPKKRGRGRPKKK